jgi:hypothetical protein
MAYSTMRDGSAVGGPGKPVVGLDRSEEGARARALLEAHGIDFEVAGTDAPQVSLRWNEIVYPGLFGVADFVMLVGRLPIPDVRKEDRAGDGCLPGSLISRVSPAPLGNLLPGKEYQKAPPSCPPRPTGRLGGWLRSRRSSRS